MTQTAITLLQPWSEHFSTLVRFLIVRDLLSHCGLVSVPWDVRKYEDYLIRNHITDGSQAKERDIAQKFPSVKDELRSVHSPTTVTDCFGRIIAWLLPDILPGRIQVRLQSFHIGDIIEYKLELGRTA